MKKLKNLTLACLLILGLAACADDDKSSSNNPPITDNSETIILKFTGEIDKENVNTIIFTNPHAVETDLSVRFYNSEPSIVIDTEKLTCDSVTSNYGHYSIKSKLAVGESCEVKYTYTPTILDTILLKLSIEYNQANEAICPTTDYVPTYAQVINSHKDIDMMIYNYAKDSDGTKSPSYINIEIPAEWSVTGSNAVSLNAVSHTQAFDLMAKQGEYSFDNPYGASLKSNNKNCSISNNTLTVNGNNSCSLTVTATAKNFFPIKFSPKQEGNPYYNVNVEINTKYTYILLDTNNSMYGATFEPEYNALNTSEEYDIDAGILKNGEKITSYEIAGTNANKFKVAGTKHNSCTVTDTEISIPEGQENCFFTVELADISATAEYTATLNTTLSTGTTQTYNINGTVILLEDYLVNYCKQSSQNKENNKQYKLF